MSTTAEGAPALPGGPGAVPARGSMPQAGGGEAKQRHPLTLERFRRKWNRVVHGKDPDYYDMYEHAGEQFYARIYLFHILNHIKQHFGDRALDLCDAGCQSGRMSIPLAQAGHRVTGMDASGFALRRADEHARKEGLSIRFRRGDILKALDWGGPAAYDVVVCLEVIYLNANYRKMLESFRQSVRPSGLIFVSHRPRHYYVSKAIGMRDFETARFVLSHQEGKLWGSYFNWQTQDELGQLYRDSGFHAEAFYPIGVFSGISGETADAQVDPMKLSPAALEYLGDLEREASCQNDFKGLGRYTLVVAKPV